MRVLGSVRCWLLALFVVVLASTTARAQLPAPAHLVAFPGGTSVALRWDGSSGASAYRVFRNGAQIATVTPGFHAQFPEIDGNGYIDAGASPGHSYSYQVQAVSGGSVSAKSAPLSVNFPAATTSVPAITLDSSQATDLAGWLQNTVRPFLQIWYPKVGDRLARPGYTPPQNFTLRLDSSYTGVAYTNNDTIVVSASYARAHPQDLGMLLHEATHVLQQHVQGGWITEGMADWVRYSMLHDQPTQSVPVGGTYLDGYSTAAYFLQWIEAQHPGFLRALNLTKHNGTSVDNDPDTAFINLADATPNELWQHMTGEPAGVELRFAGLTDRCVVAPPTAAGPATIAACDRSRSGQQWRFALHGGNLVLRMGGNCLDVVSSGTANGSLLQLWWDCNQSGAQDWRLQANGTLRNPASGRCLSAPSSTPGTQLELRDCAAVSTQRLTPRPGAAVRFTALSNICLGAPNGDNAQARVCDATAADQLWHVRGNTDGTLSLVVVDGRCLDVQGSGTANGSVVQIWGCNLSAAQKWRWRANGSLLNPNSGRCLDAGSGANGTNLRLWTCGSGAGQKLALPDPVFADGFD